MKPIKFKDLLIEIKNNKGELDEYYVTGYYWATHDAENNVHQIDDFMIDSVEKNGDYVLFVKQDELGKELLDKINDALSYLI